MKKLMLMAILVGLVAVPALANKTVYVPSGYGPYQTRSGGEFSLLPGGTDGWDPRPLYDSKAKVTIDNDVYFQSFCLETDETIVAPGTYEVILNDRAISGGVGPAGDPISLGTAYLYHEFQKGTLTNYDYTDPGRSGTVGSSADLLQQAIWYLEGEDPEYGSGVYTTTANNTFLEQVDTLFGASATNDNNGTYAVAVLNLYKQDGTLVQDMLVCIPAPGALLLGSIGIGLVGYLRRRKSL